MTVTTALYRRYRPDSFADVIGQEHVTEPLMTALRKNRVNHAYLFSGPRGCGKTTSARILARCLNCAEGPTDTPCGKCPSCIELARGGSGSLDVIEIDAASHGGVDDARDLRERATFAPVRDRYKIFIIDEAHMVTSAGFNALLKIVEEPPEHIKFIFATTEPDKVIGTIRSRTHHYPFRLVPPEPLMQYLELLCQQENVPVAPGVLSLVIRAGGGSVRDTLSVLDQLMAGAGPNGLDYELAVALLGYTHASLLDDIVDAVAASDSATVFRAVDRVIQTGHDPRRFVEDLLERFRDLIIVQAMPESAQAILRGMPADQIARMRNQATNLGAAELSRAADVTNTALTEMTGATSPRLHLELLCARILLPSAEQTERGIAARIDRVERRLNYAGDAGTSAVAPGASAAGASLPSAAPAPQPVQAAQPAPVPSASPSVPAAVERTPAAPAPATQAPAAPEPATDTGSRDSITAPRVSTNDWPVEDRPAGGRVPQPSASSTAAPTAVPAPAHPGQAPVQQQEPAPASSPTPSHEAPPQTQPAPAAQQAPASTQQPTASPVPPAAGSGDVEALRRAWPDVLQTLTKIKRSTWALVEPNAQVAQFDGQVLTLAFTTGGLAGAFGRADHSENLRQAIHKTIGIDCQIVAVAGGNSSASSEPNPKAPTSRETPAAESPVASGAVASAPAPSASAASVSAPSAPAETAPAPAPAPVSAVDSAWGLAPAAPAATPEVTTSGSVPARSQADSPAAAAAQATAQAATEAPAYAPAPAPASTTTAPAAAPAAAAHAAGPASPPPALPPTPTTSQPASMSAGDYSYPDDDWGPPLDEDAPPLDEEPPADWEPPSGYGRQSTAPPAPAASRTGQSSPEQETPSRQAAVPSAATPSAASAHAVPAPAGTVPTGRAAAASPAPASRAAAANPVAASDTSADPWSRAVEQAPGTWVVGTESNVGKRTQAAQEAAASGSNAPDYQPAAAQIPEATAGAYGHPTNAEQNPSSSWDVAPASSWPGTQSMPDPAASNNPAASNSPATSNSPAASSVPAASSAPATWPSLATQPEDAHGSVATLEEGPASGNPHGRQSLYQRLTNSPEAQAGRVQAPVRTQAAPAAVTEDIPSPEDETIEESRVFGRAAVERILGGKLIEERALDGSPLQTR
ncbi:DNA polymerase-3 subunit gamma/tau [Arthrobacter sp. yr096]|uniref:DNA polymerase III subunit gamma and tau n=1 Tax=Arthrobacter sp. yr096 TaxID=1761750 RepID=UPI0008D4A16D|nr:DNA polymerase III subunit gamma and tau [Arthrobacter sp. yr096]SEJ62263.1 DNA polymerase-3 subunit gamma/tau [Arthrobacter sp. yr096]